MLSPDGRASCCRAAGVLSPTGRVPDARPRRPTASCAARALGSSCSSRSRTGRRADRVYARDPRRGVNHNGPGRLDHGGDPEQPEHADPSQASASRTCRPKDVDYVELHGTGFPKGDPIEASVVGAVIGQAAGRARPCAVGSVKSNIGHLDSAAGIAGIIKVTLAMQRHRDTPTINLGEINPDIDGDRSGSRRSGSSRRRPRAMVPCSPGSRRSR